MVEVQKNQNILHVFHLPNKAQSSVHQDDRVSPCCIHMLVEMSAVVLVADLWNIRLGNTKRIAGSILIVMYSCCKIKQNVPVAVDFDDTIEFCIKHS